MQMGERYSDDTCSDDTAMMWSMRGGAGQSAWGGQTASALWRRTKSSSRSREQENGTCAHQHVGGVSAGEYGRRVSAQYWHSIGTDVTPGGEKRSPKEVCSPAESAAWRAQLILGRLLSFTPQERCKKSAVRPRVAHRLHGLLPSMDQTNRLSGARRYRTLRDHEPSDPEAGSFRET